MPLSYYPEAFSSGTRNHTQTGIYGTCRNQRREYEYFKMCLAGKSIEFNGIGKLRCNCSDCLDLCLSTT